MSEITLYQDGQHSNILLPDATGEGLAIQANHHIIIHDGRALMLDPGGHKVFNQIFPGLMSKLKGGLQHIFLSHQDPDIVAAINGWLMVTDAQAHISKLWTRFIAHFGIDRFLEDRLVNISDEGCWIDLNGAELAIIPAHFLHSAGNFHLYDPKSKILYTGDLGASIGFKGREVLNFNDHIQYMEGFHRRYIASNRVLKAWVNMARTLDVEILAPQHGALFRGKEMINQFYDWCENLECGVDLIHTKIQMPPKN
ncbi:MBL fold metallo-hydrolase [Myxococcota bacterium]|nr:MBL fold metallo-hydrolase [Myxococcota bacterium]MBU1899281.1 MBL fold metallo-hydrolase [Myxococcota bacterium]